jgi:hypothetical protein
MFIPIVQKYENIIYSSFIVNLDEVKIPYNQFHSKHFLQTTVFKMYNLISIFCIFLEGVSVPSLRNETFP